MGLAGNALLNFRWSRISCRAVRSRSFSGSVQPRAVSGSVKSFKSLRVLNLKSKPAKLSTNPIQMQAFQHFRGKQRSHALTPPIVQMTLIKQGPGFIEFRKPFRLGELDEVFAQF